jgi:hypothetical protein
MKYPQLKNAEWVTEQYETLGKSSIVIASEVGCSPSRVQARLREIGLQPHGRWSGRWNPKDCERCGKSYVPAGPAQRFCSGECRAGTRACDQCGAEFPLSPPTIRDRAVFQRRFCSDECHVAWRGEKFSHRYMSGDGYIVVVQEPTMSRGLNDGGYVRVNTGTGRYARGRILEHRLVMEQVLGRELLPDETVHHKNGVKTDNDPGNLELWVSKHPKGQRAEDIVEWAAEMLQRYAPERLAPVAETIRPPADAAINAVGP